MDKVISKSIGNHPAIGDFGENFTKLTALFAANLELDFFERHTEYAIMAEVGGERVALADITGELRKNVMGEAVLPAYGSKYAMGLENDIDFYLTFHPELLDVRPQAVRNQKEIPGYLLNRPVILKFIESFVNEVYDYAITLWHQIIDGAKELNQLKELLGSFSEEQKTSLKKLGKLIIEDSVLKVTGIFEGFDYWLVTRQNGKMVHISYTDPEEADFERNELAFDMHNEDIINLFSEYGLWTEM